jgi:hypothetical protein
VKLPHASSAVVPAAKVRDYLLSLSHPVVRFKAAFFERLGYTAANWQQLARDLCQHAIDNEAVGPASSDFGEKYEVHGNLTGPAAKTAAVVTVWIVLRGERTPRLVTAFPGRK